MINLDIKFIRSTFQTVFDATVHAAKIRTIVKNFYEHETDLTFKQICDEFQTFQLKFPRQIGKTTILLMSLSKDYLIKDGYYSIDTTNLNHSLYECPVLFINTPGTIETIKENINKKPDLGYVFIIDSASEAKQNTLKNVIVEIFEEYNKDSKNKIYPAFVIID